MRETLLTDEDRKISHALALAVREALITRKRLGNSIAVWRDGRVVEILPEDIVIPDDHDDEDKP